MRCRRESGALLPELLAQLLPRADSGEGNLDVPPGFQPAKANEILGKVQDLDLRNPPARPHKRIAPDVEAQYARTRLHGGEILVGVVGTIGKIGIAPPSWAGANVARAVCRIVPGPEIDHYYLAMALHSPRTQDYFRETTRTLAQPTLNVAQLEQTPIPVPQMPEQRRIAKRLEDLQGKLDKLKRVQSETAVELDALLPSILDKAFKGKL